MTVDVGGDPVAARIKGKRLRPVCGDVVTLEPLEGETDWLITSIEARRNALSRPNMRGEAEVLAANLDQLIVVAAPLPKPDWFVIDRYIAAAEQMRADVVVLWNKADITDPPADFLVYDAIGYRSLATSIESGAGIDGLSTALSARVSIFVGQSGVGKSSLINTLVSDAGQRVNAISGKFDEGRHTTVNSKLIPIADGGAVIDSPGVRDYAPVFDDPAGISVGFREIHRAADSCRFHNCRHLREPGCAVKAAVDDGKIDERRYESYRRLLRLTERLGERAY
jgi:ribosome biogenesis GTPase